MTGARPGTVTGAVYRTRDDARADVFDYIERFYNPLIRAMRALNTPIGCVATWEDRILLCRRAIEPRRGFWTVPAGFMENGETAAEAACRETHEEAGARIIVDAPFAMVSIAHINQVHLFYRGRLATADFGAGDESLEVAMLRGDEIPWDDIAFLSVTHCLEHYLEDAAQGRFGFHETALGP